MPQRHMDAQLARALLDQHLRDSADDGTGKHQQQRTPDGRFYDAGRVSKRGCTQIVLSKNSEMPQSIHFIVLDEASPAGYCAKRTTTGLFGG
jgi:hypothetical protein